MEYRTFIRKAIRRVKREIFSRFYLDLGKEEDFILIFGSGRSGTTWLADAISQAFGYRLIFEPFWHLHIEVDGIKDFFHHRYISNDNNRYNSYIKYVISGKYKNMRTNMHHRYGPYGGRVIKDICSNLFMEKILQIFPKTPIIYVIRHPCAVVLSRLRKRSWSSPWGLHAHLFNNQMALIENYFNKKKYVPRDELEDHAITYCYENYLPLMNRNENIYFIYYEKLILDFFSEMEKILAYIEARISKKRHINSLKKVKINYLAINPKRQELVMKNRVKHLYSWRDELDTKEIERIKKIVRQFKLEHVYEEIEALGI